MNIQNDWTFEMGTISVMWPCQACAACKFNYGNHIPPSKFGVDRQLKAADGNDLAEAEKEEGHTQRERGAQAAAAALTAHMQSTSMFAVKYIQMVHIYQDTFHILLGWYFVFSF